MTDHRPTALFLNVHDPSYPRNSRLREYLATDYQVIMVPAPIATNYLLRCLKLLFAVPRTRTPQVVVLSEFSLQYCWIAWAFSRIWRSTLVVDWLVGLTETHVQDWKRVSPYSPRGLFYRLMDWSSIVFADLLITDTEPRAQCLRARSGRTPVLALPVGAPDWARVPGLMSSDRTDELRVLYYGNYLPLHGVDTIVEAFRRLPNDLPLELTLVGSSASALDIIQPISNDPRVTIVDEVDSEVLATILAQNCVILGIFGDSSKAQTVIPNKVWQGLYAGKYVLTRTSPALAEIAEIAGTRLLQVAPGDPKSLGDALVELASRLPLTDDKSLADRLESFVRIRYRALTEALVRRHDQTAPPPNRQ